MVAASVLCALAARSVGAQTSIEAQLVRADSLFRAGAHAEALDAYEEVRRLVPSNSRAVFQVALLRSWRGELDTAERLLQQYLRLEPGDVGGFLTYARVLGLGARYLDALAQYDSALVREPDNRDAVTGRALTLGRLNRFEAADSSYAAWLRAHPSDTLAIIDRAHVLSWAGEYDDALAMYARFPRHPDAAKGSARVTAWRGDVAESVARWTTLTQQYPNDPEVWVGLGRAQRWLGATEASNAALQRALALAPGNAEVLAELRQVDSLAVTLDLADSLYTASAFARALIEYETVLRRAPENTRAIYQVAVLRSWRDQLDTAQVLLRRYIALEPRDLEGRVSYARILSWDGQFDASIAQYDTVLAREADYRDAALGRAQALGWAGRFADADASYARWIATHPSDTVAHIDRARVLSWGGSLDEALAIYERFESNIDAAKGIARVLAWKGDLIGGEARWTALAARYPDDPEIWVGLGQTRRWLGRTRPASDALNQALKLFPGYEDARQQLRWVDAELRPLVGIDVTSMGDSDGNAMLALTATGGWSPPIGRRATLSLVQRRAEIEALRTSTQGARVSWGLFSPQGRLSADADLGVALLTTEGVANGTKTIVSAAGRIAAQFSDALTVGLSGQRAPYDEVASTIRSAVVLNVIDVDAALRLPLRFVLGGVVGGGAVTGGADGENARWATTGTLRWVQSRAASVGVRVQTFGHERRATDGYFSPRRFQLTEFMVRYARARDLGLLWSGELGAGRQRVQLIDGVDAAARTAWRAGATLSYRPRPGREWYVGADLANVASPGAVLGDAEYRNGRVSLGARWVF